MSVDASAPEPAAPPQGDPARRRPVPRGLRIAGWVALILAVLIVVSGLLRRTHDLSQAKTWTTAQAVTAVNIITPTQASGAEALVLPGDLEAFYNAPIYARVSGYVRAWYVDIGARVKAGQQLATIDTPELDQQLLQARADLASAQANMQLATITAQRWSRLLAQDAVSKQESDEKAGDLAAKTAQVNAARANVDRLLALKSFSRIVAPFDGVVTARKTDIGALVNAGAGANTSSELFDVAKVDRLRLYVSVPQSYSDQIGPGATATLSVPEMPGRTFAAALGATANAVTARSGTLLVELMVNNADGLLKAGDYAQVKFLLPRAEAGAGGPNLELPTDALLFRKSGLEAAVVDADDHVRIRPVTVGRDLGTSIEVTSGLAPSDRVIDNPPDSIASGQLVRVIDPNHAPPAGQTNGAD